MKNHLLCLTTGLFSFSFACTPPDPGEGENEQEVITTVELSFTPDVGDAFTVSFADPENDGDPVIDDITFSADTTYTYAITFLNELEDPAEDITVEVAEESDEHQVFIATDVGASTSTDTDGNGDPLGLEGTLEVGAVGTGTLQVILQHMPVQDGTPQKTSDLQETFAAEGKDGLPGSADADVTFDVTVE